MSTYRDAETWRSRFRLDVTAARSYHRAAQLFSRQGYAAEFVAQARRLRDMQLVSARNSLLAYRDAVRRAS